MLDGVRSVDAVDLGGLHERLTVRFQRTQSRRGVRGEERTACAARVDHDFAAGKLVERGIAVEPGRERAEIGGRMDVDRDAGLPDPDNHDGVITHLEPDILECEVKWP